MSIIGIICEYNPFHSGHDYHIKKSREQLGAELPVVCVMSGDFMQRGEAALYSKFSRAEAACRCGADLVVELPLPWSLASAETFARGAVGLLAALGVGYLSFGSESGELEGLDNIARLLLDPMIGLEIKQLQQREASLSYPAARQLAVEQRLGGSVPMLAMPNNILAIEYLKAIYEQRLDMKPMTVQRFGSGHDVQAGQAGPKSASELRRMTLNGHDTSGFIPSPAAAVYKQEREQGREHSNKRAFETAVLSRLRMFDEEYYTRLPDAADGVGIRLYKAAREEPSLTAVLAAAKTKRYALARIRRMCLSACLGISAGMSEGLPPYARVLAANAKGRELLRGMSDKAAVPIVTKPASVKTLSREAAELFALGAMAHDLYVLGYTAEAAKRGGADWRKGPVIIENQQNSQ